MTTSDRRSSLTLGVAQGEAELAAVRSPELLQSLFALARVGIQLIDVDRQVTVAVNPALMRMTGYTETELLHGDPRERFPAECLAVREGWFRDVLAQGHFDPSEVAYMHKRGHRINLVFSGVGVTDAAQHRYVWLSVQDVTAFRAMEHELRAAASQDRLTGLANRATLLRELALLEARARAEPQAGFALMFLDFDRFKLVNDTLGHDAGDELLRAIARRLRTLTTRDPATGGHPRLVARLGGDEFVLLVPEAADAPALCDEAAVLLAGLAAPYTIRQQRVHSSASIGIARWHDGVASGEALLRDADIAMYEAKRRGRGTYAMFDQDMRARLTRALRVETELRQALALQQLRLAYQPIVDLETGRMTAAEALLRWDHPELGAVAPDEFIPLAEESGLIVELGEWALRQACRQWTAWQRQDAAAAPALVSVNLSRVQLALGPRLLATVREVLATTGMPPAALQLEITEREMMKDPGSARELMAGLAALGVQLAMDGFGTGASSLACLRDFPFHVIKIDRSFVTGLFGDPHVLAVAHATVNVIENLGMASVAQGIEDPSEAATLQSLGCRYGQGELFAPPLPPDALLAAMAARTGG